MKTAYYISVLVLILVWAQEVWAQESARRTVRQHSSDKNSESVINLTERARIKNEVESQKPSHVVWERLIYRAVDLTKEGNAALYYPVQPQGNRQNLFSLLFKLLADGKITAYKYVDGGEVFEEGYKKDFKEFLESSRLIYTRQGERFVVDERDIPSPEVTQYMLKEGYSFDQATGTFKTEVLAVCPILIQEDFYSGGSNKEALFWLKYDDIRPYLSREMIMTSNYNNALTYTMDDYFRKNMYSGDIIKTVNMMGKSLAEEVGDDPDALKQAQDSIETQLKAFGEKLWAYNDSATHTGKTAQAPEKKTTTKEKTTSGRKVRTNKEKEPNTKSSTQSERSAPARTVRRSR